MKTLITGALQAAPEELEQLRGLGLDLELHQDESQAVEYPEQYEAVICNGLFLYHDISAFTKLRYIQLTSAGLDRVPLDYIQTHDIELHNAAGVYSIPMAEWTIMRILELYKNAGKLYENQRGRRWGKDRSWQELYGKTACIVGFGAYGKETAKRLKAFGVRVCVVNRTEARNADVDAYYPLDQLNEVLAAANIVVMAIALTPETKQMFGEERFAAMKRGAVFVNAARGALVDERALTEALQSGKVFGAALDVFQQEPLPEDSPLWNLPNVIITPHNSFVGEQNRERLMNLAIDNLKRRSKQP